MDTESACEEVRYRQRQLREGVARQQMLARARRRAAVARPDRPARTSWVMRRIRALARS